MCISDAELVDLVLLGEFVLGLVEFLDLLLECLVVCFISGFVFVQGLDFFV